MPPAISAELLKIPMAELHRAAGRTPAGPGRHASSLRPANTARPSSSRTCEASADQWRAVPMHMCQEES